MRILMLSQFYPPLQGGEEQYVRMLSGELAARGHQVSVATLWHDGLPEFEIDQGARVYRIRGTTQRLSWLFRESERRHAPPFPDPELLWALGAIVRQERPEIVHAHNWMGFQFAPLRAMTDAKFLVSLHDVSLTCVKKNYWYRDALCSGPGLAKCFGCARDHYGPVKGVVTAVCATAMNLAERATVDRFLPVSHAYAAANRLSGGSLPFEVMPNFLPDDVCDIRGDYQSYLAQLPDEDYLLFVGALRPIKGINVLLRAYAGLQDPPPLVLIGYEGTDTPKEFPKNVTVLKNWPHAAVMAAWRRSIMGLFPSIWLEGFALSVLEAMASGRPTIASRTGGLVDFVVDGETGFLIPPGDATALTEAIQRLLVPELRERMGRAAYQRALEFRASVIVPRVEEVYQAILSERSSRQHALMRRGVDTSYPKP